MGSRNRLYRLAASVGAALLAIAVASPSFASDPPSHEVTAPSEAGQQVEVEWTGIIPPGANTASDCTQGAAPADHHTIELTVPDGLLDRLDVTATFFLEYDGPAVDAIITVVLPDGSTISGDGGFVDTDESVVLARPPGGTYDVQVCMFAGANPQPYTGRLVVEAAVKQPDVATGPTCRAPTRSLKFEQGYIDESRAGGEPIVTTHPDGTLLWGSHAGTTHFFGPAAPDPTTAAFLENYEGQTYQYFSDDDGRTWQFVERLPNPGGLAGLPNSGFSDPEFAIDAAGNVYISEINLVNIAVSKSTDSGRSYTLQNLTGFTNTDRQWMAADTEDVLYMTGNAIVGGTFPGVPVGTSGHVLTKSTDGGRTFTQPEVANASGVADIQVNPRTGDLYEITIQGGNIGMGVFRGIRGVDAGFADLLEVNPIAQGAGLTPIGRLIDPSFDMDAAGNLYIVWSENGTGVRPAGIYFSYSTDDARTWTEPVRVDPDERTEIWPWLAVGDEGQVAIVYLAVDAALENANAETAADDMGWNVHVAWTDAGLGCGDAEIPSFRIQEASAEPVHFGTICQGGTACQAELVDRRLGDYFANEIDGDGHVYISVSDTRQGGAVSLPLNIRQVAGPAFTGGAQPPARTAPPQPPPDDGPPLPTTGGGIAIAGAVLLAGAIAAGRRRR